MARSRIIAGKAVIIIEAQDLVNKTLGKVRSNLHRFSNEVGKIGEGLFRTGFFGALGSGAVINSFVKFDDAMRTLRVNLDLFGKSSREVEETLAPLEARIRSLAQTTPFNPTQVAEAATELAKGGFDPKQIEKALQAVLDLARATNTELGFSAEFVVRTLTTYGIATENAAEVVSQLVRASRKGTLGIEDLEAAMRYSSGTADTLGVSLQKMLAIFTVLSNRGLVGSIAGTSTNTAFSQLVKKAQELKDIGKIELVTGFRKDGREALDVISSLENLFKFAETLRFTEQQTLFQDVFNLRGARSVSAIRREIDNIKKLTGFIADANDEARIAAEIQDAGIGGSLRRLVSTIQELGIALGQTVEKPVVNIANTIKGLLTELNKLATLNPTLTSLVILSPGILLAAGAGMIVLAKGLRVAAFSAGLLKTGLSSVGRFLTKGTVGQLTAASIALQRARGIAKVGPTTKPIPGLPAGTTLTRASAAASLKIQRDNIRRLEQAQINSASNVVKARRAAELGAARRTLASSRKKFSGLPDFTPIPLSTGAKFISFGKTLLRFGSIVRKAFSLTGLTTALEILILFGDKIPGVSNILNQFGKGFSNAFKEIGKVGALASGPMTLFRASIEAFNAGDSEAGVKGLTDTFSALASIIGNQLVAAWNRFKEAIAPVYNFVVRLFTVIEVTIQSIVDTISTIIGSVIGAQSAVSEAVFGKGFDTTIDDFSKGASNIAQGIAELVPVLFDFISRLAITFEEGATKFVASLERATTGTAKNVLDAGRVAGASGAFGPVAALTAAALGKLNPNQKTANEIFAEKINAATNKANAKRDALDVKLTESLQKISKVFVEDSAIRSRGSAEAAINRASAASQTAFINAGATLMAAYEAANPKPTPGTTTGFPQGIDPTPLNNPAVKAMQLIADALVGSVQSTRRNLLRTGKPIEEKQLEEQKRTNELLEKQLKDQGVLFAP